MCVWKVSLHLFSVWTHRLSTLGAAVTVRLAAWDNNMLNLAVRKWHSTVIRLWRYLPTYHVGSFPVMFSMSTCMPVLSCPLHHTPLVVPLCNQREVKFLQLKVKTTCNQIVLWTIYRDDDCIHIKMCVHWLKHCKTCDRLMHSVPLLLPNVCWV